MRNTMLLLLAGLLMGMLAWAQAASPAPAMNTPAPGYFSQTTLSGCVLQSGGVYWLKTGGSDVAYLLQGNDSLLRPNLGHTVVAAGSASPAGAQAANEARKLGAAQAVNFSLQNIESVADECNAAPSQQAEQLAAANAQLGSVTTGTTGLEPQIGYSASPAVQVLQGCVGGEKDNYTLSQAALGRTYYLQGNTALLDNQAERWVRLTGYMTIENGRSGFIVQGVEPVQPYCEVPVNAGQAPIPVTGKAGNEEQAMIVSDTSSVGQVTPGNETQAGLAQQGVEETGLAGGGIPPFGSPTAMQGAPPDWEYVGETPTAANRIAAAVPWSELNPSGIFGPIPFMIQSGQTTPAPPPPGASTGAGTPGANPATAQGGPQAPPNQAQTPQ